MPNPAIAQREALPADLVATGSGFSIVIPFYNEKENVAFVLNEVRTIFSRAEIIAVDDGSSDSTWEKIRDRTDVIGLRFPVNQGQSAAIYHGLKSATGPVVGVMDGDGQNEPGSFVQLLEALQQGRADLVCGFRMRRKDAWNRRAASRIANRIRRILLKDGVRDTGCSQKVFRKESVDLLVPFRGMHRYLPSLFQQASLVVAEIPVHHRPRYRGVSKYNNCSRALQGVYDLLGVGWLLRRKILPPEIMYHR